MKTDNENTMLNNQEHNEERPQGEDEVMKIVQKEIENQQDEITPKK